MSSVLVRPQATLRRWAVLLFLSLNFLFMLTSTGRVRLQDELMTLFESESLVLRGSTAVPQAVANLFFGRYDRQGQPRAAYAPGQALVTTPWYALGQYALRRAPGVPPAARDLVIGFAIGSLLNGVGARSLRRRPLPPSGGPANGARYGQEPYGQWGPSGSPGRPNPRDYPGRTPGSAN